jgi:hypothetical protein
MLSTPVLVKEYYEHRELVDAYIKGDRTEMMHSTMIHGFSLNVFVFLLLLFTAIWFTCLYFLVRYWDVLPTWVKTITIIDMLIGTGIFALVIILAVLYKNEKSTSLNNTGVSNAGNVGNVNNNLGNVGNVGNIPS